MNIVALVAKIAADSTEFTRELKKVERRGTDFQERFSARFKRMAITGLGVGMIARGVYGIVSALNEVIDNTEEAEKRFKQYGRTMSEETKKAAAQYREFKDVAKIELQSAFGAAWANIKAALAAGPYYLLRGVRAIGAQLGGGVEGAERMFAEEDSGRYTADKESELGRSQYLADRAAREQKLKDKIDELRLKRHEESLTKEELLAHKQATLDEVIDRVAAFKGRREQRLQMEIGREELLNEIEALKRSKDAKTTDKLAMLSGMTIPKSSLASMGVFSPGSDLGALKTVNEKQLVELRKISGAVVRRGTLVFT